MSIPKKPMAEANRISAMLNTVLGEDRFPVQVDELAVEYSRQCFPDSPIERVEGEVLGEFEGMLAAKKSQSKWMILYNSAVVSEGRKRFTVAHEFGHYILHRDQQSRFECGAGDIAAGDNQDIELEADQFASTLLMPLDDFRRQVDGQKISFDLLGHCADRYGVSLTAAALRWIEIAEKRAVLIASRDDFMLWAKSNSAAYKSGAYFATRKNTIELPGCALAHTNNVLLGMLSQSEQAKHWFQREPGSMPIAEMIRVAGQYDYTLTLLLMPEAEWQRPDHSEGDSEEDTFDRFVRNGQFPSRN